MLQQEALENRRKADKGDTGTSNERPNKRHSFVCSIEIITILLRHQYTPRSYCLVEEN